MTRPGAPVAQAPYSASASFSAQQQAPPPAAPPQYSYRPAPSSVSAKKQYPPTSSGYREKAHHYKQKASSFIAKATTSIDKRFGLSSSAGNHPPRSRYGQGRSNASNPPPTISGPTNIVHKGPSELLPGQQQPSISGPMNVVHTASASQPHVPSQQQDQLQQPTAPAGPTMDDFDQPPLKPLPKPVGRTGTPPSSNSVGTTPTTANSMPQMSRSETPPGPRNQTPPPLPSSPPQVHAVSAPSGLQYQQAPMQQPGSCSPPQQYRPGAVNPTANAKGNISISPPVNVVAPALDRYDKSKLQYSNSGISRPMNVKHSKPSFAQGITKPQPPSQRYCPPSPQTQAPPPCSAGCPAPPRRTCPNISSRGGHYPQQGQTGGQGDPSISRPMNVVRSKPSFAVGLQHPTQAGASAPHISRSTKPANYEATQLPISPEYEVMLQSSGITQDLVQEKPEEVMQVLNFHKTYNDLDTDWVSRRCSTLVEPTRGVY